jgi:hypothetical protein
MWGTKHQPDTAVIGHEQADLDRAVAQRDALYALADATAELLSRTSAAAGEMLRSHALRCLHTPEAELVSLARAESADGHGLAARSARRSSIVSASSASLSGR